MERSMITPVELEFDVAIPKHPLSSEPYFVVWCDPTGINTGASADEGELQGETIVSAEWTIPAGLTKVSETTGAVTINGVSYPANTVTTVFLLGGTDGEYYEITVTITTATRTLSKTFILPVSKKDLA